MNTLTSISLAIGLSLCVHIVHAQEPERCGTMEIYDRWIKNNPEAKEKMDSIEHEVQVWIEKKGLQGKYPKKPYPQLPGYEKTGEYDKDRSEYKKAKKEYANENPEKYKHLSRVKEDEDENAQQIRQREKSEQKKK